MYVHPGYVYRRDSDKTYASCWLARVAVDSLVLRCLLKAYSDYTKQVVIYGVPSWTIIDPCTSLVDPRESIRLSIIKSIIGSILDHRIDLRKSIIDNRIDSRGSTSDVQGSIIVHPRRHSISNRAIHRENSSRRNQGNRMRYCQVLSEIYRVGVGRKETLEWKTVETELTVQRNGAHRAMERNGPWNETERTILRRF